jgi:LDH2 family malate/lactate/ureidoglycolate dehydrogenase
VCAKLVKEAVARAKVHGIGAIGIRNSNHFGTAMYFTRMAATAGCIGFLSTNSSPAIAPWGGRKKALGSNPWSIAAPAGKHTPMMLDIANVRVARGKVYLAKREGVPIPLGWALNAAGEPTTDPDEAISGVFLPMAEHKFYIQQLRWRRMQSRANRPLPNSLLTGKNTGNFAEFGSSISVSIV